MRKKGILVILVMSVLCFGCGREAMLETQDSEVQDAYVMTTEQNPRTMEEAWETANRTAIEWAEDAEVVKINSTDYLDTMDAEHGVDGTRNCWSFFFHSEAKKKQYHMYIVDDEVYSAEEVTLAIYQGIDMDAITVDSTQAYQMAVEMGITGGIDWAFGYHYLLQYYNIGWDEPVLLLVVRGLSENGNEIMLDIDPYTGEVLQYREKTGYDQNGNSIWTTFNIKGEVLSDNKVNHQDEISQEDETEQKVEEMSREEVQQHYDIFALARKYCMDPEELTDAFMRGISDDRFSPFSETKSYSEEEWTAMMTEKYGDEWKNW